MKPFKPGDNPRLVLKNHRERGPKKWSFTYADIAKACGITEKTVRNAAAGKSPKIDMTDLVSVYRFIAKYQKWDK